ncbi:MAG: hypothetical protein ABI206_16495 [Antricoccus sp.]
MHTDTWQFLRQRALVAHSLDLSPPDAPARLGRTARAFPQPGQARDPPRGQRVVFGLIGYIHSATHIGDRTSVVAALIEHAHSDVSMAMTRLGLFALLQSGVSYRVALRK